MMYSDQCNCEKQNHVHELTGSTKIFRECDDCHNHRFCTVTGEAMYTKDMKDHWHEVKFRTDFSDKHFHEFFEHYVSDSGFLALPFASHY